MKSEAKVNENRRWRLAFGVYVIILLSIIAGAYLGKIPTRLIGIPMYDLVGHFVLLGTASFLSHRALGRRMISIGRLTVPLGPVLVAIFAMIEESMQSLSPRRTFSLFDLSANLIGIILFYGLDRWWQRRGK